MGLLDCMKRFWGIGLANQFLARTAMLKKIQPEFQFQFNGTMICVQKGIKKAAGSLREPAAFDFNF